MYRISVVLPEPRNPDRIVTGTGGSGSGGEADGGGGGDDDSAAALLLPAAAAAGRSSSVGTTTATRSGASSSSVSLSSSLLEHEPLLGAITAITDRRIRTRGGGGCSLSTSLATRRDSLLVPRTGSSVLSLAASLSPDLRIPD